MSRSFLEIFKKYKPDAPTEKILNLATDVFVKYNTEKKLAEIRLFLPFIVSKEKLYEIEKSVAEVYGLKKVYILPKFPAELFSEAYIKEVFIEANRVGTVSRGFLDSAEYSLSDGVITVSLNMPEGGVELLYDANTHLVITNIIESEFGINIPVEIEKNESYHESYEEYNEKQNEILRERLAAEKPQEQESTEPKLPQVSTIYGDETVLEDKGNGIYKIGKMTFDLSSPEAVIGSAFKIAPVPLREFEGEKKNVIAVGTVFAPDIKPNKAGDLLRARFGITDRDSSIFVKMKINIEDRELIEKALKSGTAVAVKGSARQDKFDDELTFHASYIEKVKTVSRTDNAEVKRVELHLHTTLSTMDATIPPEVAVSTAHAWGHRAVAITDHENVQAYPKAMNTCEALGMKVIYGTEAYFVDDTARAVYGSKTSAFDGEFVVFDIETTGLSAAYNKITEIGAIKIKNCEIIDRFATYVNPGEHIPEEITSLTGISDETVSVAPKIDEILSEFLDFCGDAILVAHNARFDVSFIRKAAEDLKLQFSNTYLDTVALSRYVNPDLNKHTLDAVGKYYKLGDFNHHRAVDDAEMLYRIFVKMIEKLNEEGIFSVSDMVSGMSSKADPLKLRYNHMIILVKNSLGLRNLYKLISQSYLTYYYKKPRMPKTVLENMREGLIIGSACEQGELYSAILGNLSESEIDEIVSFYDYLEIQPLCNNRFLIEEGIVKDDEQLRDINRKIVALGERHNKPVCATCDAHFLNREDEIARKILLSGMKFKDYNRDTGLYFRTTDEMLEEFAYLGKEKAYEVVVTNTNLIADMVEVVRPIPKGTFTPKMEGAEEDLQRICYNRAQEMYGDPLPEIVGARLKRELDSIIGHGFSVLYMIAQKLIQNSEKKGYLVGSRGSVGSSFTAHMSGISEVNPLPPHYLCRKCKYFELADSVQYGSGFDLPEKNCPRCGEPLYRDGHDIPFETFLGFKGEKSPDIDLNFSGDVQADAHKYTEELFGSENVFRAGTLGTLADKTAYGFVIKFMEERGVSVKKAEIQRLVEECIGVKRTTGQHPGGIIVVPRENDIFEFTPVQHPADDATKNVITTHFPFSDLHDTILKLDILGHDIPTKYKMLEKYTGIDVRDVPMQDKKVMELFLSTKSLGVEPEDINSPVGTFGLPELGTAFVRQILVDTRPQTFASLLQVSGLSHGTNVWLGNGQDLVKDGICDITEVIGTRDNIMLYLMHNGLSAEDSFNITESVRKGRGIKPPLEAEMRKKNIPDWYIDSCKKIKYMFPKAHAAAYMISALRLGWFKVYRPMEFYAAFFTVASGGFDAEIVMGGKGAVVAKIAEIEEKGKAANQKEAETVTTMQLVNEFYARGLKFLPIKMYKSDAHAFVPEDGCVRIPFSALSGVGENAAVKIKETCDSYPGLSIEEFRIKSQISAPVMSVLLANGAFEGMSETNQITFF